MEPKLKMKNSPIKLVELSDVQKAHLSMGGKIPLVDKYRDDSKLQNSDIYDSHWSKEYVDEFIKKYSDAGKKEERVSLPYKPPYGEDSLSEVKNAIIKANIRNKRVAVLGSHTPWIEAILINLNNQVITIDYNIKTCGHPLLDVMTYDDFKDSDKRFDVIVSYSSIEHSGLGRYGDEFSPDADIETMKQLYASLTVGGMMLLAVPIDPNGHDRIVFNLHRIYGKFRLPKLLGEFKVKNYNSHESVFATSTTFAHCQPIIYLEKGT